MQAALEERGAAAADAGGGWGASCTAPDFDAERVARPLYRDPALHLTARAALKAPRPALAGGQRAHGRSRDWLLVFSCQSLTRSCEGLCAAAPGG